MKLAAHLANDLCALNKLFGNSWLPVSVRRCICFSYLCIYWHGSPEQDQDSAGLPHCEAGHKDTDL